MTPAAAADVGSAFVEAAKAAGLNPSPELVGVLMAQSALETGNWAAMVCFNFGNVKATDGWLAAGGDFTYYTVTQPGADAPVTENMTQQEAEHWMRQAKPRADGSGKLDMEIRSKRADGRHYCLFWARHVQTRFRAFLSLRAGAQAYLDKLTGKYAPALIPAAKGDVTGYIAELQRLGPYFRADQAAYEKVVRDRYKRYLPTARASVVASGAMPPDPVHRAYDDLPELGALVSKPDDLIVPGPDDYLDIGDGVLISHRSVRDRATGGMGRPEHGDVIPWLTEHGLRLPSPDEYGELHEHPTTVFVEPVTLPTEDMRKAAGVPPTEEAVRAYRALRMRSARWCRIHDDEVEFRARAAGYTGKEPVSGDGKWWTSPKKPGGLPQIIGWALQKGVWIPRIQDLSDYHGTDPKMTDYATGFKAVLVVRRQPWLEGFAENGVDPTTMTLSERCLAWTGYQFGLKLAEIPGATHNPAILAYSQHARRGGVLLGVDAGGMPLWAGGTRLPLGSDEEHWCAAAASSALLNALMPSEAPPHGIRVSVREICEDAKQTGALRVLGDFTGDPEPGWLAIEGRAGENPLRGGRGHVRRVVQIATHTPDRPVYYGLGGNENNTWGAGWYPRAGGVRPDGHELVAWVAI